MKRKNVVMLACGMVLGLGMVSCGGSSSSSLPASFDSSKKIKVYTRNTDSGTRDGFFTKIGLSSAKTDNAPLVDGYIEVSSNGAMVSSIKNDEYGIGYISLASLDSSGLKSLSYEGVGASEASVKDGTYSLTRNFNYIIRDDYDSDSKAGQIVKAFIAFLSTSEAKLTIKANDGIVDISGAEDSWDDMKALFPIAQEDNSTITIKYGGSTSVEKMAKALTSQFSPLCGSFIPSHNHTGSGDAYKHTQGSAKDDSGALDVGFLSRELNLTSDEKAASGTYGKIAIDAIVAVTNPVNTYASTSSSALKNIYTGAVGLWSEVINN